ncbi:penicillin-binding protein 1C [Pannonibacter phragmitetus]|uniref:penicillin-binding protein 1C n=1 Tax=Pannonibacter phragmitetus TaxID=121719 RepID=UPI003D2F3AC4
MILAAAGAGALRVALDVAAVPSARQYDDLSVSRTVLDRNGDLLRAFTASDERWRLPVEVAAVDPLYIRMLIAFEDRRFRDHGGVDLLALTRSLGQMLFAGRIVSGGSTLTMQTARLAREADTRSLSGKYQQMVAALAMERDLSKDEILLLYLLRAPFGGNLEGVRAASLVWFGKEPRRLTPAEAALLVALPQAPEARRPDRSPEAARAARDRVLDRAVQAGVLDEEEAAAAKGEAVPSVRRAMPMIAPHLTRQVVSANPQAFEQRLTLDRTLQQSLEALLASKVRGGSSRLSAAALVADHTTGEILAWVGSPGLEEESRQGHVDMVTAVRSPGSALKPFIYGLAFEEGVAHPESYIEDRPVRIGGYTPTNFDMSFQGTVTVREALQLSLNIPAVRLLDAVGPAQLTARMRRAGVEPVLPSGVTPGLAIGLGGVGLSLKDLATLYADLANGGKAAPLRFDMKVTARPSGLPLLEPAAAWYVGDVLLGVPRPDSSGEGRSPSRPAPPMATAMRWPPVSMAAMWWPYGPDGRMARRCRA